MAESNGPPKSADDISLFEIASTVVRWRRLIVTLALVGGILGGVSTLTGPAMYSSMTTFIPHGSEAGASGLAPAASQFGMRLPANSGAWGPAVYVELLRSPALLGPVALDTITVLEQQRRQVSVSDLLGVRAPNASLREELGARALAGSVRVSEIKPLGAVTLTVSTPWPSASVAIAERLVRAVNHFNVDTRKSQANAERQFVELQVRDAEDLLQQAEARLLTFLQRNRAIAGSPELAFERDRLQREVTLRTQVYTSLLQNLEEARMREVRDTPVITVLEAPRAPVFAESRKTLEKTVLGLLIGALIAMFIAFLGAAIARARREPNESSSQFFRLISEATPSILKSARRARA